MSRDVHKAQIPDSIPKPSEFYRARHPDLFSDTDIETETLFSKDFFEYYLDNLTNRKQEIVFEDFCRRLAELEICPNLKPQTGPTGGGDSKTDASTYPVAPALAERCYWGSLSSPSDEAWAFAFSCKKRWKDKVKSDVKKIAVADRIFKKIFFISNQFVPDKKRSETEDELSKKYAVDVHILDKTWIVKRVFEHAHQELAIDALGIDVPKRDKPKLGPKDTSRQQELDDLLKKLRQPETYYGNDYALAQDYLKAATISRSLGKLRHEVDSFFLKARDLAKKNGHRGQIIRCCYQHAWTSYWWFDDFKALESIYQEMEEYLSGTEDADDCELFMNLWHLLLPWVCERKDPEEMTKFEVRRDVIRSEAERLSKKTDRPTNSLKALTTSHLIDISIILYNNVMKTTSNEPELDCEKSLEYSQSLVSDIEKIFDELKRCLKRAKGMGTYPLSELIRILEELGEHFGHLPGYNDLYDEMMCIVKERSGEMEVGKHLYKRGLQSLNQNNPKDVLHYMGQAQIKLFKNETLEGGIHAAFVCSEAYRRMGLYWAARMEALTTANFALRGFESFYEYPKLGLFAAIQMALLELHLCRITPFIAWYECSWILVNQLRSMQYKVDDFEEDLKWMELVLGCFFLNLSHEDVKTLSALPNGLDEANLSLARLALLYSLGDIDVLIKEGPEEWRTNRSEIDEFFERWKNQPAAEVMPKNLNGETRSYCNLETKIFGVTYHLKVRNHFGPIAFSENLIGAIESMLATARWENIAFIVDRVEILIDMDLLGENPPALNYDEPFDPDGYLFIWKPDMLDWINKESEYMHKYLFDFLIKLLVDITIDPLEDLQQEFKNWADEGVFDRTLVTSQISTILANLIGRERYEIEYWSKSSTS